MSEIRRMSYVECEEEGEAGEDNPLPKLVHLGAVGIMSGVCISLDNVKLSQNLDSRIGFFHI